MFGYVYTHSKKLPLPPRKLRADLWQPSAIFALEHSRAVQSNAIKIPGMQFLLDMSNDVEYKTSAQPAASLPFKIDSPFAHFQNLDFFHV